MTLRYGGVLASEIVSLGPPDWQLGAPYCQFGTPLDCQFNLVAEADRYTGHWVSSSDALPVVLAVARNHMGRAEHAILCANKTEQHQKPAADKQNHQSASNARHATQSGKVIATNTPAMSTFKFSNSGGHDTRKEFRAHCVFFVWDSSRAGRQKMWTIVVMLFCSQRHAGPRTPCCIFSCRRRLRNDTGSFVMP